MEFLGEEGLSVKEDGGISVVGDIGGGGVEMGEWGVYGGGDIGVYEIGDEGAEFIISRASLRRPDRLWRKRRV